MSEHLCNTYTPGCFRCALNKEEEEDLKNYALLLLVDGETAHPNYAEDAMTVVELIDTFYTVDETHAQRQYYQGLINDSINQYGISLGQPYGHLSLFVMHCGDDPEGRVTNYLYQPDLEPPADL
jgi:hypothetical protein